MVPITGRKMRMQGVGEAKAFQHPAHNDTDHNGYPTSLVRKTSTTMGADPRVMAVKGRQAVGGIEQCRERG